MTSARICARRDARGRYARRFCQVVLDQKRRGGSDHGLVSSGRRRIVRAVPTPGVETVPALGCPVGGRVTKRPVSESTSEALWPGRGSAIESQGPHAIEHDLGSRGVVVLKLKGRRVRVVTPWVVWHIYDYRSGAIAVAAEEGRTRVETTIDKPISRGHARHPDRHVLILGQDHRALVGRPHGGAVRPGEVGVSRAVKGDDGVNVAVGHKQGLKGYVLFCLAGVDESDVSEIGDLGRKMSEADESGMRDRVLGSGT
jgi:hypothetical protein